MLQLREKCREGSVVCVCVCVCVGRGEHNAWSTAVLLGMYSNGANHVPDWKRGSERECSCCRRAEIMLEHDSSFPSTPTNFGVWCVWVRGVWCVWDGVRCEGCGVCGVRGAWCEGCGVRGVWCEGCMV